MLDNTDELKSQLDELPEEEENIEENIDEKKKEEDEEEVNEIENENEEENEEQFSMPDKFKGKSAEEVAKSYTELEGMIDKKANEKAEEITKTQEEEKEETEEEKKSAEDEFKNAPPMKDGKINFEQMTPEQFANHMDKKIEEKAEMKAREVISDSRKIRSAVQTEINDAQKEHPLLKTSSEYRELALAVIESAAAKGKTIALKEACAKVEGLIGKKKDIEQEDETKMKQAKAQVETSGGASSGGKETEEDKIKAGMLAGSSTGDLGGLGV